jgi:predicted nucleic acid-binding protein
MLLDTNVVSELRKAAHPRTAPAFAAWAATLQWSELYISVITLYELEIGVARLEAYDAQQGAVLRGWLRAQVLPRFEGHILVVDQAVAARAAELQLSRTRQVEDTLIAATAYVHRMEVVARNVADFEDTGVPIINPWKVR